MLARLSMKAQIRDVATRGPDDIFVAYRRRAITVNREALFVIMTRIYLELATIEAQ